MMWLTIYGATCIAIGLVFGACAWGDDEGNAPIIMASILIAFAWPLAGLSMLYIAFDDHVVGAYYARKGSRPSPREE